MIKKTLFGYVCTSCGMPYKFDEVFGKKCSDSERYRCTSIFCDGYLTRIFYSLASFLAYEKKKNRNSTPKV